MGRTEKWSLSEKEKDNFITNLTAELPALRAKLGISQGDLARLIGISRQTLSAIERNERKMSWDTYLSMMFFFDYNKRTHQTVRDVEIFPETMLKRFNDGDKAYSLGWDSLLESSFEEIVEKLDDKAMNTLRTTLLVEYARCADLSPEAIIKVSNELKIAKPGEIAELKKTGKKRKK